MLSHNQIIRGQAVSAFYRKNSTEPQYLQCRGKLGMDKVCKIEVCIIRMPKRPSVGTYFTEFSATIL